MGIFARGCTADQAAEEMAAQHDMTERGRRLRDFATRAEGRVWWMADSGEWFLVPKSMTREGDSGRLVLDIGPRERLRRESHGITRRAARKWDF